MRIPPPVAALLVTLVLIGPAVGKGIPQDDVLPNRGGVTSHDETARYSILDVYDSGNTMLVKVDARTGAVLASRQPGGELAIPAVAYDGSPGGLSADGRTLVLVLRKWQFPSGRSHLRVIDTTKLTTRTAIDLRGDFSFDAISPDGSRIYLIEYTAPPDASKYVVRALDTATGTLRPEPVVDPREPGEAMNGTPVTRTTSPDGRWEYTLYARDSGQSFIHALDTVGGTARCIDLPIAVGPAAVSGSPSSPAPTLTVDPSGQSLAVSVANVASARVNLETFTATPPPPLHVTDTGRGVTLWLIGGLGAAGALGLLCRLALRRRRPREVPARL